MDLVPMDVDKLLGFKIKEVIMELTLSMGIWIKPHIINKMLELFEGVLKLSIAAIVIVILVAIVAVQVVLEGLIMVLEVVKKIAAAAERGAAAAEKALNKMIDKMKGPEGRYRKMEARINGELRLLRDESFCEDAQRNVGKKCGGDVAESSRPTYCKMRLFMSSPRPLTARRLCPAPRRSRRTLETGAAPRGRNSFVNSWRSSWQSSRLSPIYSLPSSEPRSISSERRYRSRSALWISLS